MDADKAGDGVARLVRAARDGDLDAFNQLVLHFQRQVYNVCYRMLGNADDAADVTQDAFLGAYRGLKTFRGPGDGFQGWLLRIAANACYDHLRRRRRQPSQSLDQTAHERGHDGEPADLAVDHAPGPEQRALTAETAQRIQMGLQRLTPDQRLTVILCDIQGLSYEETARIAGVELGTVKSRLSRARAALRDFLVAHGELPAAAKRLQQ